MLMNTPLFNAWHGCYPTALLARTGATSFSHAERSIFIGLAVILTLVLVVILAAVIIHKIATRDQDNAHQSLSAGFSLDDLRKLHRAGQMSDEEFEAAKTLVIARSRKLLDQQTHAEDSPDTEDAFPFDDDQPEQDNDHHSQEPPSEDSDNDKNKP